MAKAKKRAKKTRKFKSSTKPKNSKGKSPKKAKRSSTAPKARSSLESRGSFESRSGVAVTFTSDPTAGMAMKVNGRKLPSLPNTLTLSRGPHSLEWTFAGPSKAKYSVIVTGAQSPTSPIDDEIRDGENSAAGTFDVQV